MARHLLLRLEGPLMSFGNAAVDHHRTIQAWPSVSLLTGLIGNALGWERRRPHQLDAVQRRIRWAARLDRPGTVLVDFQTAQLRQADTGWTTRGLVEGRDGGAGTYRSPHLRYRHYRSDASVAVSLRLEPADDSPTLDEIARALDRPARPLFLGRKGCPPAIRLVVGLVDASDNLSALDQARPADTDEVNVRPAVYFNEGACPPPAHAIVHWTSDERRFDVDLHGGRQRVYELPVRSGLDDPRRASS